jgi:hypothetical protein
LQFCAGCGYDFSSIQSSATSVAARKSEPWTIGQIVLVVLAVLLVGTVAGLTYVTVVNPAAFQGVAGGDDDSSNTDVETSATPSPGQTSKPRPRSTPRAESTPAPSAATQGLARVELVRQGTSVLDHGMGSETLLVWAEYRNSGSVPVKPGGIPSYILYRPDGSVLDDALFLGAVPEPIMPGESGYLLQHANLSTEGDITVGEVEIDVDWEVADSPRRDMTLSRIDWRAEPIAGIALEISGVAENQSPDPVWSGVLGMVFFDSGGTPIGGFYDNLAVGFVEGSGREAFTVQSFGAPASIADRIASYEAFAFEHEP